MYFITSAFQKIYLCILFATFSLHQSYNVKMNQNVKLCINCKNYQRIKKIPEELGICKLFSPDINLITGKSLYYPAIVARKIDKLCGIDGKYYDGDTIEMECNENNECSSIFQDEEKI